MKEEIRKIAATDKDGTERQFEFQKCFGVSDDELICLKCPYDEICFNIKDPTDTKNPNSHFVDFCSGLGESADNDYDSELSLFMPTRGSIEIELFEL